MEQQQEERRRLSNVGLIDSIMNTLGQLTTSQDLMTRSIAARAMNDLRRLREGMPSRRSNDRKPRKA